MTEAEWLDLLVTFRRGLLMMVSGLDSTIEKLRARVETRKAAK